jgi:hypothetical protein
LICQRALRGVIRHARRRGEASLPGESAITSPMEAAGETFVIKRLCSLAIFLAVFGSVRAARAHGVVGDYVFLEPIITQDPTPANELDIFAPS